MPIHSVSYKAVDKEPKVKKIIVRNTERKDKAQKDLLEYTQAAVGQYDIEVEKSKIGGKFF